MHFTYACQGFGHYPIHILWSIIHDQLHWGSISREYFIQYQLGHFLNPLIRHSIHLKTTTDTGLLEALPSGISTPLTTNTAVSNFIEPYLSAANLHPESSLHRDPGYIKFVDTIHPSYLHWEPHHSCYCDCLPICLANFDISSSQPSLQLQTFIPVLSYQRYRCPHVY